jgi:hypothetical protein
MARHLGTLIIAEGVETEEEAVCLLDMDIDMIQGFYFSKPQRHDLMEVGPVMEKVNGLGGAFKQNLLKKIGVKRFNMNRYYSTIMEIQIELSQMKPAYFDSILKRMIGEFPQVESVYILNEAGTQVSESVFNDDGRNKRNPILFRPSPKGSDHTMKDYFYFLMEAGINKTTYVTEPYLSMTSGSSCVTLSSVFQNSDLKRYILCLDINTEVLGVEPEA